MFDYAHYVPALRWKRAERAALKTLGLADKATITPLIELLPGYLRPRRARGSAPARDDLAVAVQQIADSWGSAPIFIDTGLVHGVPCYGQIAGSVERFFEALVAASVHAIPVTRPDAPADFRRAVREVAMALGKGVAVRVPATSLQTTGGGWALHELVAHLGTQPGSVDVIEEWKQWAAEITNSADLPRRPSFGDYTIQHPIYREPVEGANPSASIRYTSETYWVIMRGAGLRNSGGTGHMQYPANAELLFGRKEFCGPQFSGGDEYIWKVGSHQGDGPGTPETWLRAGINHHLTFAARQIASVVAASD